MLLQQTKLFDGITDKGYKKIEKCLRVRTMEYKKGQTVCSYGNGSDRIGIVLKGRAAIFRTDIGGDEKLLELIEKIIANVAIAAENGIDTCNEGFFGLHKTCFEFIKKSHEINFLSSLIYWITPIFCSISETSMEITSEMPFSCMVTP